MLSVKEKVVILTVMLVLIFVFSWISVDVMLTMLAVPLPWFYWIVGIAVALLFLIFTCLGSYAFWYIWKKVPTLTKKNKELLAKWLKDNNYVRCREVKVVIDKTFDYSLEEDGSLKEADKQSLGSKIFVTEFGVVYEFKPSFKNRVALLDNYEYSVQDHDFMILTFKYDKAKALIYRQHPS